MPETITKKLSSIQTDFLNKFAEKLHSFGVVVGVFDLSGDIVAGVVPVERQVEIGELWQYSEHVFETETDGPVSCGQNGEILAVSLKADGERVAVLISDIFGVGGVDVEKLGVYCAEHGLDFGELSSMLMPKHHDSDYISEMLSTMVVDFEFLSKSNRQIEQVSTELAQTYEELMLLYNLSTNMKVTQSNSSYLQIACDQITQMVNVEGIAIFLERSGQYGSELVMTAGAGVFTMDQATIDLLQFRLTTELESGRDALLDSDIDSHFKYDWPEQVRNLIAVPLMGNEQMIGMMVATNIVGKPDFDSIEVKLFNSVANQCAVFVENCRLFGDLKELFAGSLKALTSSIDAKDQYTRGHSERVAFISRWIAEEVSKTRIIPEEDIHKIYLAGLLHDIGKIGIDEKVLRKNQKLTDDERSQIMSHPKIGAMILSDIKQMNEITQGVLCHHERVDGKGYPNGLVGEQIPLMGRIISVADSFDAMTSRRVYRNAMSLERAIEQIRKGLGTQFDKDVGAAFIESDIDKLWKVIQDGYLETWDFSNFSEYGTEAVGTLLR